MTEVVIRISPKGETTVKVEGHLGPSCSLVSSPYRKALGVTMEDTPTVETYMDANTNNEQQTNAS